MEVQKIQGTIYGHNTGQDLMSATDKKNTEWLETDYLGGFALGSSLGKPSRGYNSLLTLNSEGSRYNLVNSLLAEVAYKGSSYCLQNFEYDEGRSSWPTNSLASSDFSQFPVKCWIFSLESKVQLEQSVVQVSGKATTLVKFELKGGEDVVHLSLRPFLVLKPYHETGQIEVLRKLNFQQTSSGFSVEDVEHKVGPLFCASEGDYNFQTHENLRVYLEQEALRGLGSKEDLVSPCEISYSLASGESFYLVLTADPELSHSLSSAEDRLHPILEKLWNLELARRASYDSKREFAADSYLVARNENLSIIAGYPWFTEWARDTFISIRGLLLARGEYQLAEKVFLRWSGVLKHGLIPNRINDVNQHEYNSVDGALWYIISLSEFLSEVGPALSQASRKKLKEAGCEIIHSFIQGTIYNIKCDQDGLLQAGEEGVQLTWMDAKCGDTVFTPRIGKPVEVQALWLNALKLFSRFFSEKEAELIHQLFEKGVNSFQEKFWNSKLGCCFDVVDVNHEKGRVDDSVRPNMLFAAGGLPVNILSQEQSELVVHICEKELFTPAGIRSLSPEHPDYVGVYQGGVWERDSSYHQGTGWYWLVGPFVEAWAKARDPELGVKVKDEARKKFVEPLLVKSEENGGHLPELSDGDSPFNPKGCPFQAWSLAEILRLDLQVLKV